jgi:zeaxanthin glucosyltransferase
VTESDATLHPVSPAGTSPSRGPSPPATLAIFSDFEEGHLFPSFKLAKDLRARGHRVLYLAPASAEPAVRRQGFELVPVFEQLLDGIERSSQVRKNQASEGFGQLVRGEALDGVMGRLRPDLVLMLSIYCAEALAVHLLYRVPIVLWAPICRPAQVTRAALVESWVSNRLMDLKASDLEATIRVVTASGHRFGSFKDLAALVLRMPELVLLPRAIEMPEVDDPNLFYIGTGIDPVRVEEPFPWSEIAGGRYLVYGSMGSQGELAPDVTRRFFAAVVGAAAAHPEWQLILSVGKTFDPADLAPVPANLHVSRWVPQLDVLRRADLMVTHGGAGTIKEAILCGVPLVVLPSMRDQFEMARRVVHHRLGVAGSLAAVTAETLAALIAEAATDSLLKERVAAMRQLFLTADESSLGVDVVEAVLRGVDPESLPRA